MIIKNEIEMAYYHPVKGYHKNHLKVHILYFMSYMSKFIHQELNKG